MKIAYVTTYDSSDESAWSGSGKAILQTLQDGGFQTESIGDLKEPWAFFLKVKKVVYAKLLSKNYLRDREPIALKSFATQVNKCLDSMQYDLIFSPGTIPVSYLQVEKPLVFWTDATFAGMEDFYPEFSDLCSETIRDGNKMEQLALTNCRLAIYSSEWAATSAIQNYDVDPAKVKVVPFGANITCNRSLEDIQVIIKSKKSDICKLIFLGVDWVRKGGDKALAVTDLLIKRGIKTELHVVGCNPPMNVPDYVKCHGFISKKTKVGRETFDKLMSESHFLILPSVAECYGVAFAEASSYGLPSIATNVGGIPTAIKEGRNGQTFDLDDNVEKYGDYIENLLLSKQKYSELSLTSFEEYSERLNWSSASKKVKELILTHCN